MHYYTQAWRQGTPPGSPPDYTAVIEANEVHEATHAMLVQPGRFVYANARPATAAEIAASQALDGASGRAA